MTQEQGQEATMKASQGNLAPDAPSKTVENSTGCCTKSKSPALDIDGLG